MGKQTLITTDRNTYSKYKPSPLSHKKNNNTTLPLGVFFSCNIIRMDIYYVITIYIQFICLVILRLTWSQPQGRAQAIEHKDRGDYYMLLNDKSLVVLYIFDNFLTGI